MKDLTPSQRVLLRMLARRDRFMRSPLAVDAPWESAARQLANRDLVEIQPCDDLGFTWVVVTPTGRATASKLFGGLFGVELLALVLGAA